MPFAEFLDEDEQEKAIVQARGADMSAASNAAYEASKAAYRDASYKAGWLGGADAANTAIEAAWTWQEDRLQFYFPKPFE
jgi:hypothetical protein